MCFPIGCLRVSVGISAVLTFLLGIAALVCAIMLGKTELFVGSVKDTKQGVMYTCLVLGVVLIIIGISGMVGSCKKSSCCLAIYNIGTGIFMLLFLALGIGALVLFKKYKVDLNNQLTCRDTDWLKDVNEFSVNANNYFCHAGCPCNLNGRVVPGLSIDPKGPTKIQDCPNYHTLFEKYNDYLISMETMERELNCAGICEPKSMFYMFSNVNNGEPVDACGPRLMDYLNEYSTRIGIVAIVIGVVLLVVVLLSCCLCCHPHKKDHERDYYSRLH